MAAWLIIRVMVFGMLLIAIPIIAAGSEDQLVVRTYKLDAAKVKALREMILDDSSNAASASDLLRGLLLKEGIAVPASLASLNLKARADEKAFYYNERTGELHLRANRRDIPKFEKYLGRLSPEPARVEIQTVVIEIPRAGPPAVNFPILQPNSLFTNLASLKGFRNGAIMTEATREVALRTFRNIEGASITELPAVQTIHGRKVRIETDGANPYVPLEFEPIEAPISSFGGGALIIRSESDVR